MWDVGGSGVLEVSWAAVEAESDRKRYKAEKRRRKHLEHEAGEHEDRPVRGCAGCEPWLIPFGVTPDPRDMSEAPPVI